MLPLYQGAHYPHRLTHGHKGLWFERFFAGYNQAYDVEDEQKQIWIAKVAGDCGNTQTLSSHALAQARLCQHLGGQFQVMKNTWHVVTGMGNNHPVENGFSWHPTLGTPYLTGAAVKGLLRAWVEEWSDLSDEDIKKTCHRWFGSESKDPEQQNKDNQAGLLIFFDALPVKSVRLGSDIMTPHMGDWYQQGNAIDATNRHKTLPADWHNPIPVPFLVAKEVSLHFCIAPRNAEISNTELNEIMQMLAMAVEFLGVGAKTAAGYGHFVADGTEQEKLTKALKLVERQTMSPEEAFRDEINDPSFTEAKLAEHFRGNMAKTQQQYEAQGADWETILSILIEEKSAIIQNWQHETPKTAKNKAKAYKNLQPFLPVKAIALTVIHSDTAIIHYAPLAEQAKKAPMDSITIAFYQTMQVDHIVFIGNHYWSSLLMRFELDEDETVEEAFYALMEAEEAGAVAQKHLDPFIKPLQNKLQCPCELCVLTKHNAEANTTLAQQPPDRQQAIRNTLNINT